MSGISGLIWGLDYLSALVFAITGALVASRRQLDLTGFIFMAAMTAVGGGTLRDLLLNGVGMIGDGFKGIAGDRAEELFSFAENPFVGLAIGIVKQSVMAVVTGAAGFIGSRIWATLTQAGHEVVAVDAMLAAAHSDGAAPPPDCRQLDIRDGAAVAGALDGIDVVCHQAAVVGAGVNAADAPSYGSHND